MLDTTERTVQVILVSQERIQERIEGKITDDLVPQLTEVPIPQTGTDRRDSQGDFFGASLRTYCEAD